MPFPSNQGSKARDLARAWDLARNAAGQVKVVAQRLRDASAAGAIDLRTVINLVEVLANARDNLNAAAAVPGIAAYAQEQVADPSLDVSAAFSDMLAQIDACRSWVLANFPQDGSGYLLFQSFDPNGRIVFRTIDSGSTAGLRTQLDALIATID